MKVCMTVLTCQNSCAGPKAAEIGYCKYDSKHSSLDYFLLNGGNMRTNNKGKQKWNLRYKTNINKTLKK